MEGTASGTPGFMAPELALGNGNVDGRADLYALGCVAYWLLTGRLVFEGPNAVSILVQHAKETPLPPSRVVEVPVDPELERLVMDLLDKDPAGRPASATELDRRLAAIQAERGRWTQEEASRWWRAHLPHLAGPRSPAPEPPVAAMTS
jgi:serine/threonine-protein kinase